jgi:hypothetical protein
MPQPKPGAAGAQAFAHSLHSDVTREPDERSAYAKLRELFAQGWCAESVAELAQRCGVSERHVRRAIGEIRRTYGRRFREVQLMHRRSTLTVRRRILPPAHRNVGEPAWFVREYREAPTRDIHSQGVEAYSENPDLLPEKLDLEDPPQIRSARVREAASVSKPPLSKPRSAARVRSLESVPRCMRGNEGEGVREAFELVKASHGAALAWELMPALRRRQCAEVRTATELALQTIAKRGADEPISNFGGYFWDCFKRARAGNVLHTAAQEARRTRELEAAEAARHDGWIDWGDFEPPPTKEPPREYFEFNSKGVCTLHMVLPEPSAPPLVTRETREARRAVRDRWAEALSEIADRDMPEAEWKAAAEKLRTERDEALDRLGGRDAVHLD